MKGGQNRFRFKFDPKALIQMRFHSDIQLYIYVCVCVCQPQLNVSVLGEQDLFIKSLFVPHTKESDSAAADRCTRKGRATFPALCFHRHISKVLFFLDQRYVSVQDQKATDSHFAQTRERTTQTQFVERDFPSVGCVLT